MDSSSLLIDGFGPLPFVRPTSVSDLAELVKAAAAEGDALYPVGGQTMLGLGTPPSTKGQALDLRGLAEVIDFPARDMTITVQAGITVAALQQILAPENLRLPIDVPQPDRATLGGILATNTSGSRRYGFGTLRDYVIGISAINDEGQEFKAGGRVVKNVAGYDLCKLMVGSLGTLGIITQVTLKLRPLAEEQALLVLSCPSADLESTLNTLHATRTRPVCLNLFNRAGAQEIFGRAKVPLPEGAWVLVIGFEGNPETVKWQVQQLICEMGSHGSLEALIGFTADPLWQAMAEWPLWPGRSLTVKANVLPAKVAGFCQAMEKKAGLLGAYAGNGIIMGHLPEGLTKEQAAPMLNEWRTLASESKGTVVVPRCPSAWKDTKLVWGPSPPDAWLMHEVKKRFDPRRLFNPGRFVDGI